MRAEPGVGVICALGRSKRGSVRFDRRRPELVERLRAHLSAARPGGLLQLAKAVFDLLLVLGLGQFSLSNLNQLGRDCGFEEAFDEVHEFSKANGDSAL
jgi:hypothetical protein